MRPLPLLIAAVATGLVAGAGVSWWAQPAPRLPTPLHGKGPHMLVEAPPPEMADATGAWPGSQDDLAASAQVAPRPADTTAPTDGETSPDQQTDREAEEQ